VNKSKDNKSIIDNEYSRYLEEINESLKEKIKELQEEIRTRAFNPPDEKEKVMQDPEDTLQSIFLHQQIVYFESEMDARIKQ
jgi:gas vesicle protein